MKINLAFNKIIKNYNDKTNFIHPSMQNSIFKLAFILFETNTNHNKLFEGEEFRISIIDKYVY